MKGRDIGLLLRLVILNDQELNLEEAKGGKVIADAYVKEDLLTR